MSNGERPTLLWIDDDCRDWGALQEAFSVKFETHAVDSYNEGKRLWERGFFDCVVVDVYLPNQVYEFAGLGALEAILELHASRMCAATVLSVTISEHVEGQVQLLRNRWTTVDIAAISKGEVVSQGLDQFVKGLAHSVRTRRSGAS